MTLVSSRSENEDPMLGVPVESDVCPVVVALPPFRRESRGERPAAFRAAA